MKEIMYGYDSVVKLTDAEKKAIPYMILANQFLLQLSLREKISTRNSIG